MLAYTTITDVIQLPSALEAVVYLAGLAIVLAAPYLFFNLVDKFSSATKPSQNAVSDRLNEL
ncbi:hypothetical protein S7335_4689 [Synechococcus sp. PCC 7335]|uniref:hypothetical protein n=1 Tax=Synechococcus sp. (strain ATCC 29403 / PCC 7335) TaxID=91464 RepID=UPI00017ECE9F|nr:hypothetical protein [Synechococcus sp. PCC 7335]EDX86982.1 hypothetical protein S7335_4689 [Synechococcus sp. PCC 7335]